MNILLTGATGFIGQNLLKSLVQTDMVYALELENEHVINQARVNWVIQDLSVPLEPLNFPNKIDAVIHLAQSLYYRQFPEKAQDIYNVNIQSTFHLLEYARKAGANHFIYASSGGIYAASQDEITEDCLIQPNNFYTTSKYVSELMLANYASFFTTVIFRFFFVYGPGQKGMLIPGLIDRVQKGEKIKIDGKPGIKINPTYIDDVVSAFKPALNLSGKNVFNIAGDERATITDIVSLVGQLTRKSVDIDYTETRLAGDLVANNAKMKNILGVFPRVDLREGIRRMVENR